MDSLQEMHSLWRLSAWGTSTLTFLVTETHIESYL